MAEDNKRQLVWDKIESYLSQYDLMHPDGRVEPDHEIRRDVKNALTALRSFFIQHGLLKNKQRDDEDRKYYLDDFTSEGLEMIRRGAEKWADSKAAIKDPPDFKKLDRMLEELRGERG